MAPANIYERISAVYGVDVGRTQDLPSGRVRGVRRSADVAYSPAGAVWVHTLKLPHGASMACHEMAHMMIENQTGRHPSHHDEREVCALALEIARELIPTEALIEALEWDVEEAIRRNQPAEEP